MKPVSYIISDIHGMSKLFNIIIKFIDNSHKKRKKQIILLGDLISKGPNTRKVIDSAIKLKKKYPDFIFILGNHDEWILNVVDDKTDYNDKMAWLEHGGDLVLEDYKVSNFQELAHKLKKFHPSHIKFFQEHKDYHKYKNFVFVHAGIDRDLPLDQHEPFVFRWKKEGFIDNKTNDGRMVIHGHSPTLSEKPEIYSNRIGLDTGSAKTGKITCMVLDQEDDSIQFFQTKGKTIKKIKPLECKY